MKVLNFHLSIRNFFLFQVNEILRKTIIPCDFFFDMKMANLPPLCAVSNCPYFRFCVCIYDIYDITNHDFLGEIGYICLKV